MRYLLALALVACGPESPGGDGDVTELEPAAPPTQSAPEAPEVGGVAPVPEAPVVEPMVLVVDTPRRGARTERETVYVSGRLTGGEAPTLTIAGRVVVPEADGWFGFDAPVERGLAVLATEAIDGEHTVEDRRAVLVGPTADPGSSIDGALHVAVGPDALASAAALLSDYLSELDVAPLVHANLPEGVEVESLEYGRVRVRLFPREGHLEVYVAVDGLRASVAGTVTRLGVSATFRGSASADPAEVVARVVVTPTADGALDFDVTDAQVTLRRFDYDLRYVPELLEDWFAELVREQLEGVVEGTLRDLVVPALFDAEALTRSVEVLGTKFTLGLGVREIELRGGAVVAALDARAEAPFIRRAGDALAPVAASPSMDAGGDVDLAIAADLVTRIAHAVWAAGLLDLALDESSELDLPVRLTPALVAPMLGQAGADLDLSAPLYVRTLPLLPPVAAVEAGERPLILRVGDLLLELSTDEGPLVTLALQIEVRATLAVEAGDEIQLDPDLDVTVHADVAHSPRGPVEEARLERMVEELAAVLPRLVAEETFAFGADVIPVPIRFVNPVVSTDGAAPFVHVRTAIE